MTRGLRKLFVLCLDWLLKASAEVSELEKRVRQCSHEILDRFELPISCATKQVGFQGPTVDSIGESRSARGPG